MQALAGSDQPATQSLLRERLTAGGEADEEVRGQLMLALQSVESRLA